LTITPPEDEGAAERVYERVQIEKVGYFDVSGCSHYCQIQRKGSDLIKDVDKKQGTIFDAAAGAATGRVTDKLAPTVKTKIIPPGSRASLDNELQQEKGTSV